MNKIILKSIRYFSILGIVSALVFSFTAPIQAKTVRLSKSVKAGQRTKIDTYQGWKNDCSFLTINIDVVQKPKSGTTNAKVINSRISRAQTGSAGKCIGKPTKGLAIYYRANPGFKGRDNMKIRMKVRGQAPVTFVYSIRVR